MCASPRNGRLGLTTSGRTCSARASGTIASETTSPCPSASTSTRLRGAALRAVTRCRMRSRTPSEASTTCCSSTTRHDAAVAKRKLRAVGVGLVFTSHNLISGDPGRKVEEGILELMDALRSDEQALFVASGLRQKFERGLHTDRTPRVRAASGSSRRWIEWRAPDSSLTRRTRCVGSLSSTPEGSSRSLRSRWPSTRRLTRRDGQCTSRKGAIPRQPLCISAWSSGTRTPTRNRYYRAGMKPSFLRRSAGQGELGPLDRPAPRKSCLPDVSSRRLLRLRGQSSRGHQR